MTAVPKATDFYALTPEKILTSVETLGCPSTGRAFALNSYENRVCEVELEKDKTLEGFEKVVVKFYRPGRWTQAQIQEEHSFLTELSEGGVHVAAPFIGAKKETLFVDKETGLFFAVFPKVVGRPPFELKPAELFVLGEKIGLVHDIGAEREAKNRVRFDAKTIGLGNLKYLQETNAIPIGFKTNYTTALERICELSQSTFEEFETIRIHGDCHGGNLLWVDEEPVFMDFDDMANGPAVQDVWILVSGNEQQDRANLESFIEGYETIRPFDRHQLVLIEVLRALRYVHMTAWVARRWSDPAFPRAFPDFGTDKYWDEKTRDLQDQRQKVEEIFGAE